MGVLVAAIPIQRVQAFCHIMNSCGAASWYVMCGGGASSTFTGSRAIISLGMNFYHIHSPEPAICHADGKHRRIQPFTGQSPCPGQERQTMKTAKSTFQHDSIQRADTEISPMVDTTKAESDGDEWRNDRVHGHCGRGSLILSPETGEKY